MDQGTIQTILEGGILVSLISIAKSTSDIAKKTGDGGNTGGKGGVNAETPTNPGTNPNPNA